MLYLIFGIDLQNCTVSNPPKKKTQTEVRVTYYNLTQVNCENSELSCAVIGHDRSDVLPP